MTRYEVLIDLANQINEKAKEVKDPYICRFLRNAAIGYKNKALKLSIEEATKEVLCTGLL